MEVNIQTLLALPQKERKKIAEQLWDSLSPANTLSKEDKKTIDLLDKRWIDLQTGKSKVYTSSEMKSIVDKHRKSAK